MKIKSAITAKNNCEAAIVGRLSFPHLFEKYTGIAGAEPKYCVSLLFPKTDIQTKDIIDQAIQNAVEKGIKNKWGGKRPKNLTMPLKDGDEKFIKDENGEATEFVDENYAGQWYLDAKSNTPIQVYDQSKGPRVLVEADPEGLIFYGGCYGAIDAIFAPYDAGGNRGVTLYLSRVLKLEDGEPFGNRASTEEVFGVAEDDEDFMN